MLEVAGFSEEDSHQPEMQKDSTRPTLSKREQIDNDIKNEVVLFGYGGNIKRYLSRFEEIPDIQNEMERIFNKYLEHLKYTF